MGKKEELTATDKLLQVIKGKDQETTNSPPTSNIPLATPPANSKISRLSFSKDKKTINIGIDLADNRLRLVKATRKSAREWQILDTASFEYPSGVSKGSAAYKQFIEGKIKSFCNVQECSLWALVSAANVEIRHIRIPKVAKKDISNAVYWTFKKEFPYDENEFTLDYEIRDEILVGGSAKISVMAYIAPKAEIAALSSFFSDMGLNLSGITIQSFAIQNILRSKDQISGDTLAFLYIGPDSSRIDIYSKGNLTMTRGIKAGTQSMAEALYEGLNQSQKACSYEIAVKTIESLGLDKKPVNNVASDLSDEQIFAYLTPALDRIVRQVERTFDYYRDNLVQGSVQSIMIMGMLNAYEPLAQYFGNQLGMTTELCDPAGKDMLDNAGALGRLSLSERMAFIPALGAACSDIGITSNLMYGYRDKESQVTVKKINKAVIAGFLVLVLICAGYFINQNIVYSKKKAELKSLESKLASFSQVIDRNALMAMADQIQKNRAVSQSVAERYHNMAILGEISAITPREIKLIRLEMGSNGAVAKEGADKSKDKAVQKTEIKIEGIIQGEPGNVESLLTGYTFKLDSSPLFEGITIQKSDFVPFIGKQALQFVVSAKIS